MADQDNSYAPQDPQQQQQYGQPQQQQQYAQPQQAQQQYAQPQQQYAQPQPQPQPQYVQPQYVQQGAPAKSATTLIVLSVLEILFLGGLFAIIPLVFSIQANSAYKIGDIAGGDAKAKTAKTALIVIAVVCVVLLVILFATGGFAFMYSTSR